MDTVLEIQQVVDKVEKELPTLKAMNPVQHDIIQGSLQNMQRAFGSCQSLFDEDLINLYKLGFKNEQSVKAFYESLVYTGFLTFYDTYLKVIQDFGENTILIPFEQFTRILDQYGLISGPFDRYNGRVPHHVIQAIKDANEKCPSYVGELYSIRDIVISQQVEEIMQRVNKFPFYRGPQRQDKGASRDDCDEFGKFYGIYVWQKVINWESDSLGGHLFIAAPAQEMIPLKIVKVVPQTSDPLVCSFIPHIGIIVLASWGPEGKDLVLRLYRLLSMILKKIKENEIIQTIFADCEYEAYKPSKMPFGFPYSMS